MHKLLVAQTKQDSSPRPFKYPLVIILIVRRHDEEHMHRQVL